MSTSISAGIKGKKGEDLAVSYLKKNQFEILERNWRASKAEIDLIAKKKDRLFFIEVKLRQTSVFGLGSEAIHPSKQKHLMRAALHYLQQKKIKNFDIRFAAFVIQGEPPKIEFFEFPLDLQTRYY